MTSRRQRVLTLRAAGVSLLATSPLSAVFDHWTWALHAGLAILAMCGVGLAVRSLPLPSWAATAAMIAAVPEILLWRFPEGTEPLGFLPTAQTPGHLSGLATTALIDLRTADAPFPDLASLLFLATVGAILTALAIDTLVVVAQQPAIAGLPMLASYSVPVAVLDNGTGVIPFLIGSAGYVALLGADGLDGIRGFGRHFREDAAGAPRWTPSASARSGVVLGVTALAAAAAIPLMVPQLASGFLDAIASARSGQRGSTAEITLSAMLSGNLNRTIEYDMLRIQTNDTNPYYIRFGVADQIDLSGFKSEPLTEGTPVTDGLPSIPVADGVTQRQYRATIEIIDLDSAFLPIYQHPVRVDGVDSTWFYDTHTSVVYSDRETTNSLRYTLDYVRPEYSASALRTASSIDSDDIEASDTDILEIEQIASLVDDLTQGWDTQYDQVLSIFNYFSPENGFTYRLTTKSGTSETEIVDFLTNRQGYCVQYSAAMAWLVRQAGYPARVAFGFSRGTADANSSSTTITLTNFNLHAWTEVYFSGFGWVPFDPTPATGVPGSADPAWAPNPSGTSPDPVATSPTSSETAISPLSASEASQSSSDGGTTGSPVADPAWRRPQLIWWPLAGVAAVLALGLLGASPLWRRRALRVSRLRTCRAGDPVAAAHAAWDEVEDSMLDIGMACAPTWTPRDTAAILETRVASPEVAEVVWRLARAKERATYSPGPSDSSELASSVEVVRSALLTGSRRMVRFQAAIMPRSVVRRFRRSSHWDDRL